MPDGRLPVPPSLDLLEGLHAWWMQVWRTVEAPQCQRKWYHPESGKDFSLEFLLALYAWHGDHHLGHLKLV